MTTYLRAWLGTLVFACGGLLSGCDQLSDFRTGVNSVYAGEVVGSDSDEGQTTSFIRQGFESHTRLDMTFDPARASAYGEPGAPLPPAGTIDTYLCLEQAQVCPAASRVPGQFQMAALEPIPNLTHDSLSQYDFPGGGRLRNYILVSRFVLSPTNPAVQGAAMVFVSLMDNGRVELRIIAPPVPATMPGGIDQPALFGVFMLERQAR